MATNPTGLQRLRHCTCVCVCEGVGVGVHICVCVCLCSHTWFSTGCGHRWAQGEQQQMPPHLKLLTRVLSCPLLSL